MRFCRGTLYPLIRGTSFLNPLPIASLPHVGGYDVKVGASHGRRAAPGSGRASHTRDITPSLLNHPLQTYTPSTELEAANNRPFPPAVFLSYSKPSAEALVLTSCPLSPSLREQGVGVRVYNEEFVFYSKYLIP